MNCSKMCLRLDWLIISGEPFPWLARGDKLRQRFEKTKTRLRSSQPGRGFPKPAVSWKTFKEQ
jgi:hypothetical protein